MFRFIVLILLLSGILNANITHEKVQNILGDVEYNKHYKLINILFNSPDNFKGFYGVNYEKLLGVLKDNGLLKLKYDKPKELNVEFIFSSGAIKSLKILNKTLKSLGYYYYFTKKATRLDNGAFLWTIKLQVENVIDPLILIKELKKKEIFVSNIVKEDETHWIYSLDTANSKISKVIQIDANEQITLQKPLKNYFLKVNNVDGLKVVSQSSNRWYPYIVFYDIDLNVLKVIKEKKVYKGIQAPIPNNTQYIKIGDMYNLINIKRGLSIIVQSSQGE